MVLIDATIVIPILYNISILKASFSPKYKTVSLDVSYKYKTVSLDVSYKMHVNNLYQSIVWFDEHCIICTVLILQLRSKSFCIGIMVKILLNLFLQDVLFFSATMD
jgi:hypothetical protein